MCNVTNLLVAYSNAVKQEKRAAKISVAAWQEAARAGLAAQQALYMYYEANPASYTPEVIAMEKLAISGKLKVSATSQNN